MNAYNPNIHKNTYKAFEELDIDVTEPVFTSGVVCKLLEIPIWVLKQLDAEGIVSPVRTEGYTRLYSLKDLALVKKIWFYMQEHHVKINGIRVILTIEEG